MIKKIHDEKEVLTLGKVSSKLLPPSNFMAAARKWSKAACTVGTISISLSKFQVMRLKVSSHVSQCSSVCKSERC